MNNKFRHIGVMLDCSRNRVLSVVGLKKFIDYIAKMGYNTLELYTEDTYEIKGEPYFGHFRGRYTQAEIKEVDAYAKEKGVELIPCIQTLAHFTRLVNWRNVYDDFVDTADILLIDDERTYELIEKMFKTLSENFTSRNVNIGMDEAHFVGLGKYLNRHGYVNRSQLIIKHLGRVAEIAKKYGFSAHMWSDMFFRLINNGNYYGSDLHVPEEIRQKLPENVELTYWNYYSLNEKSYDDMFAAHNEFGKNVWFAGGAWSWAGFAPFNEFSLRSMRPAMTSANRYGVKDILITAWGDDGAECSPFSLLPSLYAIRQYADGNFDQASIEKGFTETFGYSFGDFMALDLPNRTQKDKEATYVKNQCKCFLYNDCFLGLNDPFVAEEGFTPYAKYAEILADAGSRAGEFAYLFDTLSKLCKVLELKKDLGLRTRKAYDEGDKEELKAISEDYAETVERVKEFYKTFKAQWFKDAKPFGWEVQDNRLGALMNRITSCKERLDAYLAGEISTIEELGERPVEKGMENMWYGSLVSACNT